MTQPNYSAHLFTFAEVQQILKAATTASLVKDLNTDQSEQSIAQDIYDGIEGDFYNYIDDREFAALSLPASAPLPRLIELLDRTLDCGKVKDGVVQALYCATCDGTGEVRDEANADATLEDDGYRDTTPKINCAVCGGTGFAFDVSPAFPSKLGVQTASPLTSTSSRGVVTTSPREAETPALSLDLQVTIDAVRLLNELLPTLALDGSIGYRLLDRAVDRLRASQTRLLTGEQELA